MIVDFVLTERKIPAVLCSCWPGACTSGSGWACGVPTGNSQGTPVCEVEACSERRPEFVRRRFFFLFRFWLLSFWVIKVMKPFRKLSHSACFSSFTTRIVRGCSRALDRAITLGIRGSGIPAIKTFSTDDGVAGVLALPTEHICVKLPKNIFALQVKKFLLKICRGFPD